MHLLCIKNTTLCLNFSRFLPFFRIFCCIFLQTSFLLDYELNALFRVNNNKKTLTYERTKAFDCNGKLENVQLPALFAILLLSILAAARCFYCCFFWQFFFCLFFRSVWGGYLFPVKKKNTEPHTINNWRELISYFLYGCLIFFVKNFRSWNICSVIRVCFWKDIEEDAQQMWIAHDKAEYDW